jgi:hypothetical protein
MRTRRPNRSLLPAARRGAIETFIASIRCTAQLELRFIKPKVFSGKIPERARSAVEMPAQRDIEMGSVAVPRSGAGRIDEE